MAEAKSTGDDVRIALGAGNTTTKVGDFLLSGSKLYFVKALERNGVAVFTNQASAEGDIAIGQRRGEYQKCDKTTGEAWAIGQTLYWDPATKKFTTTAGALKAVAEASAVAGSSATIGDVILSE